MFRHFESNITKHMEKAEARADGRMQALTQHVDRRIDDVHREVQTQASSLVALTERLEIVEQQGQPAMIVDGANNVEGRNGNGPALELYKRGVMKALRAAGA